MQRVMAAGSFGEDGAGVADGGADPFGHVVRGDEVRVVGVDLGPAGRQRGGGRQQFVQCRRVSLAAAQVRWHSLSSQSPPTLRRYRMVPSTPRSLVKFASRLASVSTGCVSSTPDQGPGAGGDVGEVLRCRLPLPRRGRRRRRRRCRASRRPPPWLPRASPVRAAMPGSRVPTVSPGWISGGNSFLGRPRAARNSVAHSPATASKSPVVEALVASVRR